MNPINMAKIVSLIYLFILVVFIPIPISAQELQATLEIGKPITGEIKAGVKQEYSFDASAGNTVAIQVNQKGIDVIVRAYAPDGRKLAGVDAPIGDYGAESLWFTTTNSGKYKIELEPYDNRSGLYELLLVFIRPTLPQDKQVIAAQTHLQNSYNNLADAIERLSQGGVVEPNPTARTRDKSRSRVSNIPIGATAECRDGTYSFSRNRRGTCSHHGGVKRWL